MSHAEELGVIPKKMVRRKPTTEHTEVMGDTRRRYVLCVYAVTAVRNKGETREQCDRRIAELLDVPSPTGGTKITLAVLNHETGKMESIFLEKET